MSIYPIPGDINFGHLVKMVPARFLTLFVINNCPWRNTLDPCNITFLIKFLCPLVIL